MNISDLPRVYDFDHVLTGDVECYAIEGGLFVLYSHEKNRQIMIDPIGMTADEIERAVTVGDTVLARAEMAPANRHERRKAERLRLN